MNLWMWSALVLVIVTAGVLLAGSRRQRVPRHAGRRFEEALRGGADISNFPHFESRDTRAELLARLERLSSNELDEVDKLLAQAGWSTPGARYYFLLAAWLGPLAAGVAGGGVCAVVAVGVQRALRHPELRPDGFARSAE